MKDNTKLSMLNQIMAKDKNSKKNENEIDAYKYAEEFEKLSLEIVLYKECINNACLTTH